MTTFRGSAADGAGGQLATALNQLLDRRGQLTRVLLGGQAQ
jgi:hypothetical protein